MTDLPAVHARLRRLELEELEARIRLAAAERRAETLREATRKRVTTADELTLALAAEQKLAAVRSRLAEVRHESRRLQLAARRLTVAWKRARQPREHP